ncbi:hypothetical protein VKS41_005155 [Umbelopsis sp. WA50703]
MPLFGSKVHNENNAQLHKDAKEHHGVRDVAAAGGVDWLLRRHEKKEDKKDPTKNHDHKARDAVLAGGVGLGLHEHDKHKREKAQKEEAARAEQARAANIKSHNAPVANTNATAGHHGMAGPGVAAGAGVAGAGVGAHAHNNGAGVTGAGAANGRGPSNSHARSLKTKGKMDSFFGGLFCSHSMKMRGIERQQAANQEYRQVAHLREADRLQAQANAHARAAGVA